MIKQSYILILLLWANLGLAQKDSIALPIDCSSVLTERQITEDLGKKYTGEDFDYDVKTGESANLLSRFVRWFLNAISSAFGFDISPKTLLILEYIIYALMGVLVIYLLVRMFINEKFSSIFTQKARSIIDLDLSEQHIESIDLDSLMEEALKNGDYRLAVRYQFLKILKLLSQKNIIDWHFEKTNVDYEREITQTQLQLEFKKASYLYENIWYGEQPIDASGYAKTDLRFKAVENSIPR
ncbi:hypothetical protein [Flagellimonas baculiformis]|uniref:hypothetical protein n=1 Tax=Flagellimonas baculiformis TaxID=3067310 RepID=UPI00296E8E9E|nr:hypothetical protein [Muricauda sp. D6]